MPRTTTIRLLASATLLAAVTACGAGTAVEENPDAYPSRELDWTIAFGPGGGNDIMARTIVEILQQQELYPHDIVVENREGGSGATGWGHLLSSAGDPYVISTTSGSFITTPLQADTGWTHADFTHVGLFATDDTLFITPDSSGITTWEDWVAHAKDAGTVSVGGIGTVNVDYIIHAELADQAGYEIEYVPFNEEGQLQTALSSGAIDAMVSNPGSIMGQVDSGDVNALLFSGEDPLEALPDVPTAADLGYDGMVSMPRGLILPPETPDYAREWWIETMKRVVATDAWQDYLEKNHLTEDLRWGDDFTAYLEETGTRFEDSLEEQGAV
ncbi:Bug family tripartite tricarboxylate transporter substrate binding protein [Streptomonospora nanhaiensis]|uniref:Tripartite-type tricarboxylate transporter receptor subunit TctC n=1 Tax=Streptomonospora nanhaiensis TaxID=1323731 RepID=A0A853BV86_9ACTN|nr:tripartite tricarboxylate transporter substrate binding protein [Streptomonospora nanhaiensis]MBV2365402.1 tripartite tricarboxylate transporter substrate binding protein [Streptomonospora nanhaiensis]MBX9390203.1 tripartite tricarboxylate transporter substrate binding protein [Streptomonospora nanhaiensis]NYI99003.1 tripartite-type tricarboxylate transporter receptor subunit TctC [Streptomonospora nanhaiensis]